MNVIVQKPEGNERASHIYIRDTIIPAKAIGGAKTLRCKEAWSVRNEDRGNVAE